MVGKKVSIVVPVYNVEKYLAKCLSSLIEQTYKNIEIICINDGSTDCSPSILREFQTRDERIIVINKRNEGLSAARNDGIKVATGDYISFVDSDDWLEQDALEKACRCFNSDIDVVVFSANIADHTISGNPKLVDRVRKWYNVNKSGEFENNALEMKIPRVVAWNKLYRAEIIRKNKLEFPKGLLFEDVEFYSKYMLHVRNIFYIPDPLYNYVLRENSIMDSSRKGKLSKITDRIKVMNNVYEYYDGIGAVASHAQYLGWMYHRCIADDYKQSRLFREKLQVLDFAYQSLKTKSASIRIDKNLSHIAMGKFYKAKIVKSSSWYDRFRLRVMSWKSRKFG